MWEIRGDSGNYKDCLIYVAGNTQEEAEKLLERMLSNPTEEESKRLAEHTNIRVAEEKKPWYL